MNQNILEVKFRCIKCDCISSGQLDLSDCIINQDADESSMPENIIFAYKILICKQCMKKYEIHITFDNDGEEIVNVDFENIEHYIIKWHVSMFPIWKGIDNINYYKKGWGKMEKCCGADYVMDLKNNVFKISKNSGYRDQIDGDIIYYEEGPNEKTNEEFYKRYHQAKTDGNKVVISVCKDNECLGDYTIEEIKHWFKLKRIE